MVWHYNSLILFNKYIYLSIYLQFIIQFSTSSVSLLLFFFHFTTSRVMKWIVSLFLICSVWPNSFMRLKLGLLNLSYYCGVMLLLTTEYKTETRSCSYLHRCVVMYLRFAQFLHFFRPLAQPSEQNEGANQQHQSTVAVWCQRWHIM